MKGKIILMLGILLLGLPGLTVAQESARVRVQLIAADQTDGPSDASLSPLMSKLKRMPYKRFRQKGSQVVTLQTGQSTQTGMSGHSMNLKLDSFQNRRATMNVNWKKGGKSVVNLTAVTSSGSPFVCGGPREGGTTWIAVFSLQ